MKASDKINELNTLNVIIKNAVGSESTSEMVTLIVLSARAAVYLRNNDMNKFDKIENQIEEAIDKHKKYLLMLKKSA